MKHKDKLLHFAVNFALTSIGLIAVKVTKTFPWGLAVALVIPVILSIGKEIYDWHKFKKNYPEYNPERYASKIEDIKWDLLADLFGYVVGAITGTLVIMWVWQIPF